MFGILAVLGIIGIIYAAVEFHKQSHRPTKRREEIQMYANCTFVSVILGYLRLFLDYSHHLFGCRLVIVAETPVIVAKTGISRLALSLPYSCRPFSTPLRPLIGGTWVDTHTHHFFLFPFRFLNYKKTSRVLYFTGMFGYRDKRKCPKDKELFPTFHPCIFPAVRGILGR